MGKSGGANRQGAKVRTVAERRTSTARSAAKPTAEVTQTHIVHGVKWHEVSVTFPNGTRGEVSVNASVFPTKTAAKAEAIRNLQHGPDQNMGSVARQAKATYASELARIGVTPAQRTVAPSQHEHLATLAREEGNTRLAAIHERIAQAAKDYNRAIAVPVVYKGKSKEAVAQRAAAEVQARDALTRLRAAQNDLASAHATSAPATSRSLEQHTIAELKAMAREQGVKVSGTKAQIIANLRGGASGKPRPSRAKKAG